VTHHEFRTWIHRLRQGMLKRSGGSGQTGNCMAGMKSSDPESSYRSLVENLPANVVRYDLDCRIVFASPQFERSFGTPPARLLGMRWSDLGQLDPVQADRFESTLRQVMATGVAAETELVLATASGRQVHQLRIVAERDMDERIFGVIAVGMDITEKRRAESRLALLSFAMNQVSEAVLLIDQDARIIYANQGAATMLGYAPETLTRMTLAQLRDRHDPSHWAEHWLQLQRQGSMVYEVVNLDSAGREVHLEVNATYFEVDGQGYDLALGRDITSRKLMETAREEALLEAERLAQAKTEFLANMSHEIRTPLNAILSIAQLGMRLQGGEDRIRKNFSSILDAGQLLVGLLNDTLDFAKIDAGKLNLEMGRVDPYVLVDSVVELSAARAWAKGLNFRVEEAPDLPLNIPGDPLRLAQILVNLLSNAIKFTDAGSVALKVERLHSGLRFTVSDTGIGMTEEQIERLFMPFEQADGSTTRRFGGTGLGLAISKRLTDLMGGSITATGRPGMGMTFRVDIPVRNMPPSRHAAKVGQIGMAGPGCALELIDELPEWGVEVVLSSLQESLENETGLLLLLPYAALAQKDFQTLATQALDQGRRLALVLPPGGLTGLPQNLLDRFEFLDWPPRSRHVQRMLRDDRPRHGGLHEHTSPRLAGIRILAAEDNELNRVILEELLILEGASVTSVENGKQLLDRLRRGPAEFDVVLTDVQMPVMDGYEATRQIRYMLPELPVIGLTAHVLGDEPERCLASGMSAHVGKPAHLNSLVRIILQLIDPPGTTADSTGTRLGARQGEEPEAVVALQKTVQQEGEIDWPALAEHFEHKQSLIQLGLHLLLERHPDTPARLRSLAATGDVDQLKVLAHNLKGMAGNLQAMHVRHLATQLERCLKQNPEHVIEATEKLAEAMERLLQEAREHLVRQTPAQDPA
jgi:PAS domain S-box-containing protein